MENERAIANDLKENSLLSYCKNDSTIELKPGVGIKLPYQDIIYSTPIYEPLPHGIPNSIFDSFDVIKELFSNDVPEKWISFIETAVNKRKDIGLDEELDFCHALGFFFHISS